MRKLRNGLSALALLAAMPSTLTAEAVTVYSLDNTIKISGDLTSFNDETITIETPLGALTVDRDMVTCEGAGCPTSDFDMNITFAVVSDQTIPLVQSLISGYAGSKGFSGLNGANQDGTIGRIAFFDPATGSEAGEVNLDYQSIEEGFSKLLNGEVQYVLSPVPVPASIADGFVNDGGYDLRLAENESIIALDALVPVVNPSNRVRAITVEEISGIVSGRIVNWAQLGGDNLPIKVLLPEAGSAADAVLEQALYAPSGIRPAAGSDRLANQAALVDAVADDAGAFTLASVGGVDSNKTLPIQQVCGPIVYASDFSLKAEEYPLQNRLYLYRNGAAANDSERDMVDFMSSRAAQPLVGQAGFIGQNVVAEPISLQGSRMASAITSATNANELRLVQDFSVALTAADRLSTTFRFESGSARLDNKSREDLDRMVEFLNSDEARGRNITLIGFSDSVGRFDLNERLSFLRASSLRTALIETPQGAQLADRINVASYGPLAPVSCNDTLDGREGNRRVEVWLQ